MEQPKLMDPLPEGLWVDRLRPGHRVWLPKQQRTAFIAFPWDPPGPGHIAGRLALDFGYGRVEVWFVRGNGNGLDNLPLVRPLEGNLPKNPGELEEPEMRSMRRQIAHLTERINRLEQLLTKGIL